MEKIKVYRVWLEDDSKYDFRTDKTRRDFMEKERLTNYELDEFHVYDSPFMVFNRWVFEEDKTWEQK